MKKGISFSLEGVFLTLLSVLAVALGADSAFAMSVAADVVETDKTTFEGTADDKGLSTQLDGKAATATHATETGFEEDEIEQKIAVFRPYRFPLEYDIIKNAQQVAVKSYHPIHYRSGSNELEAVVGTADITGAKGSNGFTYSLTRSNIASGIECLTPYSTVYATKAKGYNDEGVEDGELCLFVTNVTDEAVTLIALNAGTQEPVLPKGSKLILGTTAGYEAQMVVEPDNYQPVPVEVYLQKKLSNIVFTDEWMEQAKKVPFIEKDIRQNALFNFKRKNARTHWLGVKKRITVKAPNNLGEQHVYFEEGVLRQIPMVFAYKDGALEFKDLNTIAKMQFAKHSANNEARVYCGKNAIEALLNIDMTIHKEVKFEDVTEAGMTIRKWKNNFGTLEFVHDPTLDDIGKEDYMAVIDIKNAVRYVKRDQRTDKQDMKKGTGEVQEAQREIFSTIDCLALKGYNAILVGPQSQLDEMVALSGYGYECKEAATLSANDPDGTIVILTANAGGFNTGDIVVKYNGEWKIYNGDIVA